MSRPLLAMLALTASVSCDNGAAFHEPDPTLARMLDQRRADPYEATAAFADGKVMRHPPPGTVPADDDTDAPPPAVSGDLLRLGRARYDAFCAVCHGITGTGESVVATKMVRRPPPSLVDDEQRGHTRAELFKVVTEGYGLMASYADMLTREERWAVVAYVQALQLSRRASVESLPASVREALGREAK